MKWDENVSRIVLSREMIRKNDEVLFKKQEIFLKSFLLFELFSHRKPFSFEKIPLSIHLSVEHFPSVCFPTIPSMILLSSASQTLQLMKFSLNYEKIFFIRSVQFQQIH